MVEATGEGNHFPSGAVEGEKAGRPDPRRRTMTWFGTDVMALACIVGGATAGGAATLAMRTHDGHRYVDCAVEARAVSPRVIVTSGGTTKTIVVSPDVRVHSRRNCGVEVGEIVEIHVDKHLRHIEELGMEMSELEIELEGLERALEFDFKFSEGLEPAFAFQFDPNIEAEIQAEIQAEMGRVFEQLEKMEKVRHR
jgi:hypothetical protein